MTRQEIFDELVNRGVAFDKRAKKAILQGIYDKLLHVHHETEELKNPENDSPEETEEERLIREAESEDDEPELDADGNPIDPELGGDTEEDVEVKPESEFEELFAKIGSAKSAEPKIEKDKPFIETTKRKKKKGESSPDSFRIEGYILLLVTDTVFPFAFAFLNNMLDKKIKIDATELQLSEQDFNKLEPLADQAADYMAVNLNPVAGFLLVSTFMYGNNVMIARMQKSV